MTPEEIMKRNTEECRAMHQALNTKVAAEKVYQDRAIYMQENCNHTHTIAPCKPAATPSDYINYLTGEIKKEKEQTMYPSKAPHAIAVAAMQTGPSIEQTQRQFINDKLYTISYGLESKLEDQFHLNAQNAPRTAVDLIKAITEGNYSLDQKKLDRNADELHYHNSFYGIIWGKDTPDLDGYKIAREALRVALEDARTTATLGSIEEGRQALKDFAAWTYTAPAADTTSVKAS
jgi:hypothetical protein